MVGVMWETQLWSCVLYKEAGEISATMGACTGFPDVDVLTEVLGLVNQRLLFRKFFGVCNALCSHGVCSSCPGAITGSIPLVVFHWLLVFCSAYKCEIWW